jgi:hypothetical protein
VKVIPSPNDPYFEVIPDPEAETLVMVTWTDAWYELEEGPPKADYLVRTVGWVLNTDGVFLTIASEELPGDDGYRAITHIPKSTVQSVKPLAR